MSSRGIFTARETFTMTETHQKRLNQLSIDKHQSKSEIVRKALDMYFAQLDGVSPPADNENDNNA